MAQTTFVTAVNAALATAMRADERVIVLGEDVAEGGPYLATEGLAQEFGTGPGAPAAERRQRHHHRAVGDGR